MNDLTKNLLLWVVVAIVLMVVFQSFSPRDGATASVGESPSYTRFLQDVDAGRIRSVVITDESTFTANAIRYKRSDGTEGQVVGPNDPKLMDQLYTKNVDVVREKPKTGPGFWGIVLNFLPDPAVGVAEMRPVLAVMGMVHRAVLGAQDPQDLGGERHVVLNEQELHERSNPGGQSGFRRSPGGLTEPERPGSGPVPGA